MSGQHEEEVLGKAYDARLMKRLLRYLRPYVFLAALAMFGILAHAVLQAVGPFLTKEVVDRYLTESQGLTFLDAYLSPDTFRGITQIAILYILVLVTSFAVEFLQTYTMQLAGQKAMFDLRMQIFSHLQRLHVGFFDRNPVGRLVTRLTTDIDALNEMFASGVLAIFGDFFTLTVIMGVMLWLNAPLALVTFAVLPLIALATALFRKRVRDSYRRIRTAIARINAYLQEHISGMAVVQLFNREEKSFREFETVNRRHMGAFKDAIFAHALFYPTVEILSAVAIGLVLWYGGLRVLDETLTLGVVVAFIQYAQRFYRPIMDLSEKYNILQGAMASAERVFKLLDTPVEVTSPATPVRLDQVQGRIEFRNVWFAYRGAPGRQSEKVPSGDGNPPAEPEWVLKDVSFTIEPGQTVAIVGHTGAGKTTLSSLLLRFYDVQLGQILLDGVDLRQLELTELRRLFGVVLQHRGAQHPSGQRTSGAGRPGRGCRTGEPGRFHPLAARRLPRGGPRARGDVVDRPEAARQLRPRAGAPAAHSGAGRGHLQRGYGNRNTGARGARPHGDGPHLDHHRPPPVHRAARRLYSGDAQGAAARVRHPPGVARRPRHLLEALPVAIQGSGSPRLTGCFLTFGQWRAHLIVHTCVSSVSIAY